MHAAQPKRPLPFTALSYDPAKGQSTYRILDYLTIWVSRPICPVCQSARSLVRSSCEPCCRVAWHGSRSAGGPSNGVQERISHPRREAPGRGTPARALGLPRGRWTISRDKTEGAYHPHSRNQCCKFCHAHARRWCLPISARRGRGGRVVGGDGPSAAEQHLFF